MEFPTIEEILHASLEQDVSLIEAHIDDGGVKKQTVYISNKHTDSIKNFLKLAKAKNDRIAFYQISKFDAEDYVVDLDEITEDEYGSIYKRVLKDAKEYNKNVQAKENEIFAIDLFIILDGIKYALVFFTDWVDEFLVEDFLDKYQEEMNEIRSKRAEQNRKEELVKQKYSNEFFLTMLMSDQLFQLCSTKPAKISRLRELANENENQHFMSMTKSDLEAYIDVLMTKKKYNL